MRTFHDTLTLNGTMAMETVPTTSRSAIQQCTVLKEQAQAACALTENSSPLQSRCFESLMPGQCLAELITTAQRKPSRTQLPDFDLRGLTGKRSLSIEIQSSSSCVVANSSHCSCL